MGHKILLVGPSIRVKSMLAKRIPTILPSMTQKKAITTTKIHSVLGQLKNGRGLLKLRPFRSPHHTISDAGLIGGGRVPMPGEVSMAHNGVLFLDELPEFKRNVLEVLRQSLEDGEVSISRAAGSITYPANLMLVAAMNPCPCGYRFDPKRECGCTPMSIKKYVGKISGPLLDRIDLHIEVPALDYKDLSSESGGERSETISSRVEKARSVQLKRFHPDDENNFNILECNNRFGGASSLSLEVGLDTFYWFLLEVNGADLNQYPFIRSKIQKKQIRYPENLILF